MVTDEQEFEIWWAETGIRTLAFSARDFARAGWLGHKIHGSQLVLDKTLELCDKSSAGSRLDSVDTK